MIRRTLPILLLLALSLALAAPAAQARSDEKLALAILNDYVKSGGRIDACKYTQAELKRAKDAIPADNRQYGAALVAALDDAIAARAQGGCDKKKQAAAPGGVATQQAPPAGGARAGSAGTGTGTGAGSTAAPQGAAPGTPVQAQAPPTPTAEPSPATSVAADDSIALASRTSAVTTDPPVPVVLLTVLAGLLALGALMFAAARWFAWEPVWSVRLRHAAGEAGWRASSTFSEFADFVRLGR